MATDWDSYLKQEACENNNLHVFGNNYKEEEDVCKPEELSVLRKLCRSGLIQSEKDIEIQKRDPSSPLYSVKTFEELKLQPNLLKGIYDMGFMRPSKIQESALPTILADPPQNLIAQAQSGTGKTAAFALAMLSRVDTSKNYPQILCLSPTYELAIQTGEVVSKMAKYCPRVEIVYAVRGEVITSKLDAHIVIGTPGKMLDWALKYKFIDLTKISMFVLDEADIMISQQGHVDQCIRIHRRLGPGCQMLFFSATYSEEIMDFADIIVPKAMVMRLKREEECLNNIKQLYVECENEQKKYQAITNLYGVLSIGQSIIFCRTRQSAAWLAEKMQNDGHAVALLSGELTIEDRIKVLDRFREGLERVLVTTNVLSRGIDIEQVTIVVNFDLPVFNGEPDYETYLHRIGRTGRFGKSGLAVNLVDGPESMHYLKCFQEHFKKHIIRVNTDDADEIASVAGDR